MRASSVSGVVFQVRPPSDDRARLRSSTKTMFESFGSTRTWLKYIGRPFSLLTSFHVLPLSSDRQSPGRIGSAGPAVAPRPRPPGPRPPPPSSPPPAGPGSISAYTLFGFERKKSNPTRPHLPYGGSPPPSSFFHVLPASIVFHIALPGPPPFKPHALPPRRYQGARTKLPVVRTHPTA